MKKTILIKPSILVEIEEDELEKDFNKLDQIADEIVQNIETVIESNNQSHLGWQSTRFRILEEDKMNCGRCAVCNSWVTDREKENPIFGLSNGAVYNGQLLCDEHLPHDHRWAF